MPQHKTIKKVTRGRVETARDLWARSELDALRSLLAVELETLTPGDLATLLGCEKHELGALLYRPPKRRRRGRPRRERRERQPVIIRARALLARIEETGERVSADELRKVLGPWRHD